MKHVDRAQLERWAYGRSTTPEEHERASLAADELQRRAALERERAELAATEDFARAVAHDGADDTAGVLPEPLTEDERRYRRRMLATGIAGVTAAALALVGGIVVLSQPNPDPLAIFDRAETALDREWAQTLALDPSSVFTAGPRVFRDDDGLIGIVARVSTVPDGRSTDWDAYCLYVARQLGDDSLSITSACADPQEFSAGGLSVIERTSSTGGGFDTAIWGPSGAPRVESNVPLDERATEDSLMRVLANPLIGFENAGDVAQIAQDPDRLLMGPRTVFGAPSIAGSDLTVQLYLLRGSVETAEPELCIRATHPDGDAATACTPLTSARESGIFVVMEIADQNWIVSVDAAGGVRAQQAQVAIPD